MNIAGTLAYIKSRVEQLTRVIRSMRKSSNLYRADKYKLESRIRKIELDIRALKAKR